MKNALNDLEKDVLSRMIDNLDDLEGRDGYVSDLAFTLFECENIDGTMTYSTYKASQWIMENFHDLGDVVEDMEDYYGTAPENPFKSPETFQLQVVLYLAGKLIYESDYLARSQDEECDCITYDTETITLIRREWEEALNS